MLTATSRNRLLIAGAAAVAVWLGSEIANEQWFWPGLATAILGAVVIARVQMRSLPTLLLAVALAGYVIGNRGFAQLSLATTLPILPAEVILLITGALLLVQSASRRELPAERDPLNAAILLWMAVCACRLFFDLRFFGVIALRDFAVVYYAAFFFIAQSAGRDDRNRRFLTGVLLVSCLLMAAMQVPYDYYPGFFMQTLTLRGAPLIFYKGDLVGMFMATGALILFLRYEEKARVWLLLVSLLLVADTWASNNRAALLGLAAATALLAVAGRWRFVFLQAAAAILAGAIILLVAYIRNSSWETTPVYAMYERVVSFADPQGNLQYSGAETGNKGANNLFRAVWWRAVFDETMEVDPWRGLGFGYDLADRFTRVYYPDAGDEFTTRSPHNILLTLFGRTGLLGLLPFLAIAGLVAARTVRAARQDLEAAALWCTATVVLVSACFGVVLEGPMGAVVFWVVLGLANAASSDRNLPEEEGALDQGETEERSVALPWVQKSLESPR